jgi:hypothetical protein
MRRTLGFALAGLCSGIAGAAPNAERPLRYQPDSGDFLIENGAHRFNRPLYGGNRGFRIEAGDRPEFALFLPGRGGNIRLGLGSGTTARLISDATNVRARYRPGGMLYEVRDPLLGTSTLHVTALPRAAGEGLLLSASLSAGARPARLLWAFAPSDGNRGRRNGDLGAERVPLADFFAFTPERARGTACAIDGGGRFKVTGSFGALEGGASSGAAETLDGNRWAQPLALAGSAGHRGPATIVGGSAELSAGRPFFLAIQRPSDGVALPKPDGWRSAFAEAESRRAGLAGRLGVETPDPYIDAAARALAVAADAIWDEPTGAYMHGAVGWRVRLLGWRGAYAGDALGWHDRTRRHFVGFAGRQNTDPIPDPLPSADATHRLARNERALHTGGNLAQAFPPAHYDMNLIGVDTLFRHLRWTGDLRLAREMRPALERHFEWQRRLFRRPFGPDASPLYEAYACIWASDELMYSGGGVTHATAYNIWHRTFAASIEQALGHDPSAHRAEADLTRATMRRELWMPELGWFAESKDSLGLRSLHPSAALWTFYHTVDSEAATPLEAWQMARAAETQLARIPFRGPGVPDGCSTFATTNWMPYTWSINNVATAETTHGALAFWQAGHDATAFSAFKGALVDTMFMGACPGNVGMTTPSDVFSSERYRDFADPVGITSRALVEGLFGIQPDLIVGQLRVRPGFPPEWDRARIRHPGVSLAFQRKGTSETYEIESRLACPAELRLEIPALRDRVETITVNGTRAKWEPIEDSVGAPRIRVVAAPSPRTTVAIRWAGDAPAAAPEPAVVAAGERYTLPRTAAGLLRIEDPQGVLRETRADAGSWSGRVAGRPGHRTLFAAVAQGMLRWIQPLALEVRPAMELLAPAEQTPGQLRFRLRNNTGTALDANCAIALGGTTRPHPLRAAPRGGETAEILWAADGLPAGSHVVQVAAPGGALVSGTVTNWRLAPAAVRWESIDLAAAFNDALPQIFRNRYLAPRFPGCSLALPEQGIGGWCLFNATAEIDDAGLRAAAGRGGGRLDTPFGIPFQTPSEPGKPNVAFVSRWENYPVERVVPLSGKASRAAFVVAGSAPPMQCRMNNGEVEVRYADGTFTRLPLHSPVNWWPIEQDFHIDRHAFARPEPVPPRIDLKTGAVRVMDPADCTSRGRPIPGGAATVLDLPLDPAKELQSLTLRALTNDSVIGLVSLSLARGE